MTTIDYYNQNNKTLIEKYDSVKPLEIHELFEKYIEKNSSVLDIGFGSGRDLNFIRENITNDVFGLDGSIEFVKNIQKDYFYKNRISLSVLPSIDISKFKTKKFDTVISIAVLMHLCMKDILKTVKNMKSILKPNGKIIISYSTKSRNSDDRSFYNISKSEMTNLFASNQFREMASISNNDSLNRDIEWITQIFKGTY
jgi:cyclopropane fatty-acyl-phospholipid synthase-like methyltransferase